MKKHSGHFKPGQSGNPNGRPPGKVSRDKLLRDGLKKAGYTSDDVVAKIVELGMAGDAACLKIIADRMIPTLKAQAAPIKIGMPADADIRGKVESIVNAIGNGSISADTGSMVLSAIADACKVIEYQEFEKRLEALESQKELSHGEQDTIYQTR